MQANQRMRFSLFFAAVLVILFSGLPALSEDVSFPTEGFTPVNPTLPNSKLDFNDDSNESCCVRDYIKPGTAEYIKYNSIPQGTASAAATQQRAGSVASSEFDKSNPRYFENSAPIQLVECEKYARLPETVANATPDIQAAAGRRLNSLPISSYSINVSTRTGAEYFTDPAMRNTSDFHIETAGGSAVLKLKDVNSYSVCMARGNNVVLVANTDNASIITYNGNDHVYLAGNNTNMMTRTGAGHDIIEVHQAQPVAEGSGQWMAYNIYKTALSGSEGEDTVVIRGTPQGTKWCHIGSYKIAGETFFVVEFALPPSVTEGPRRQRINIGQSVEFVVFKGRRYGLNEFLTHGDPMDSVARSVPPGSPLPFVKHKAQANGNRRVASGF